MNMRILDATRMNAHIDTVQSRTSQDLKGFVCFIPSIVVGEPMIVMYSNAISVRHKTSLVTSYTFDRLSGVYKVETADTAYELLNLEHGQAPRKKRIASTLYTESRVLHNPLRTEKDPDGHLFADGRYRTKIYASDLPDHFVYGYLYKQHGFISASGVRHMLYVPNYTYNHRHKYDTLYISYEDPIRAITGDHGLTLYDGSKHTVDGSLIIDFVDAAERYSGYDISEIRREIRRKSDWYDERFRKDG